MKTLNWKSPYAVVSINQCTILSKKCIAIVTAQVTVLQILLIYKMLVKIVQSKVNINSFPRDLY